jgi:hypothetical protein
MLIKPSAEFIINNAQCGGSPVRLFPFQITTSFIPFNVLLPLLKHRGGRIRIRIRAPVNRSESELRIRVRPEAQTRPDLGPDTDPEPQPARTRRFINLYIKNSM